MLQANVGEMGMCSAPKRYQQRRRARGLDGEVGLDFGSPLFSGGAIRWKPRAFWLARRWPHLPVRNPEFGGEHCQDWQPIRRWKCIHDKMSGACIELRTKLLRRRCGVTLRDERVDKLVTT